MDSNGTNKNRSLLRGILIYAILLLVLMAVINFEAINEWLGEALLLLRPIIIGLAVAYLANPFFRFFERKLLLPLHPQSLRRTLSLILTYLTLLLIFVLVILLIIPQLIESVTDFASEYKSHLAYGIEQFNKIVESVNTLIERFTQKPDFFAYLKEENMIKAVTGWIGSSTDNLLESLSKLNVKPITTLLEDTFTAFADVLFGFFISLYLLSTKEKRYAQVMKLRLALFGNAANKRITDFCKIMDRSFGNYIEGKMLDSLVIGLLTYVILIIFQIPYAMLISTFVGVTNIVPIIGPIIGAVPTAFILLLTAPAKVIPFLIIILVIQQLDGNVIGPKILGNNTGISSLCVVIAIAVMGSLWGLIGMILGVPLFAAVLQLNENRIVERLQKKGLPSGLGNYYAGDSIVAPEKDTGSTTDKTVQQMERRVLHIEEKQRKGLPVLRRERILARLFRKAHKLHLISELSDEAQTRFAAENAALEAERLANEAFSADQATENS